MNAGKVIWKTCAPALASFALAMPAMAVVGYSAHATYCVSSPTTAADCILRGADNQSTPFIASAGYYAQGATYSGGGGLALSTVTFAPSAPSLLDGKTYNATANARVSYSFQLVGRPNEYVPLFISGNATAGAIHATDVNGQVLTVADNPDHPGPDDGLSQASNYDIYAVASFRVFQPSTNRGIDNADVYSAAFGDNNESANIHGDGVLYTKGLYFFLSNTAINVTLSTQVALSYTSLYNVGTTTQFGTVTASADPVFEIADPAFSDFKIVGVPSAVPEPNTWVLMAMGLGVAGVLSRRRQRRTDRRPHASV